VIAVDTNILVHAHRAEAAQHQPALEHLRQLAEGSIGWGLPVFCLAEFARVVTHPRLFDRPSTLPEVSAWLTTLCASPTLRILNPGPRFPAMFVELLKEGDARGNLAFDAQIAALCQEHGISRLLTLDRDFARFPGLQIVALRK
jgi:toxin-antitoxin system PIN domain toxin